MKKTNILYWVFTALFAAFMLFSAIPSEEGTAFIVNLGYPKYIVPFLSIGKFIGVALILIPGFPRLKEWAYAGLVIDLIGAVYSLISKEGFQPSMTFMLVPFILFALSYIYYHKRRELQATA